MDAVQNVVGTVAPGVAGPVKGNLVSAGIKTVRGFVDRIQKGDSNSSNDGVHTNR